MENIENNPNVIVEEQPVSQPVPPVQNVTPVAPVSVFDGNTWQLIGWQLLGVLLSFVTLGIGTPWAICMVMRWEIAHTVVEGKRLRFDGKGHQLLGKILLWSLLTFVTIGIFAFCIPVAMNKWRVKHTFFDYGVQM